MGGTYINYGINFTFGPSVLVGGALLSYGVIFSHSLVSCVGGALPLNLPERILKPTPLKVPEGTHQRDPREAEEDLKVPAPKRKLKELANVWKM